MTIRGRISSRALSRTLSAGAGFVIAAVLLSACAGGPGDVAEGSATASPSPGVSVAPTSTAAPTPGPSAEPTEMPQDPDAAVAAACNTLNAGYDQGRDGWLTAREQASSLTAGASSAGDRYAQADATMTAFARTTYPGASSSPDEVNTYLDSYLAVVSMCADFGVTLKTE